MSNEHVSTESDIIHDRTSFRIFGLACNHTMDRITFCRLICFFDQVFSKMFGEKWWCPWGRTLLDD